MIPDRTIEQAVNASTLSRVLKQIVILPDGHQDHGFPVCVVGMDIDRGVISPESVGCGINCKVTVLKIISSKTILIVNLGYMWTDIEADSDAHQKYSCSPCRNSGRR